MSRGDKAGGIADLFNRERRIGLDHRSRYLQAAFQDVAVGAAPRNVDKQAVNMAGTETNRFFKPFHRKISADVDVDEADGFACDSLAAGCDFPGLEDVLGFRCGKCFVQKLSDHFCHEPRNNPRNCDRSSSQAIRRLASRDSRVPLAYNPARGTPVHKFFDFSPGTEIKVTLDRVGQT